MTQENQNRLEEIMKECLALFIDAKKICESENVHMMANFMFKHDGLIDGCGAVCCTEEFIHESTKLLIES